MPIQRIPRYELLLKELFKVRLSWDCVVDHALILWQCTPEGHPDVQLLTDALKMIKEIASYVNEDIRQSELMHKVGEIQSRLSGKFESIVQPSRLFVREGPLMERYNQKPPKQRHIFLFNDSMLCASKSALPFAFSDYEFKYMVELNQVKEIKPEDPEMEYSFMLAMQDGTEIALAAESQSQRDEWLAEITKSVESSKKRQRPMSQDTA